MEEKYQNALRLLSKPISVDIYNKFVVHSQDHKSEIYDKIKTMNLDIIGRFNVWRMLLEILPINGTWEEKVQAIEKSRKKYIYCKQQAKTGIKHSASKESPLPKNPLMKVMIKSEKKQTQSDNFLNDEIKKDVDRTYQELQFFQDQHILKILANILFVWCKLNPDVSYKQGMNELLASLVYVYFKETVLPKEENQHDKSQEQIKLLEKYYFLNSVQYAEADLYCVFEKIMIIQKQMFKTEADSEKKGLVNPNSKNNTPILQRIIQIQDHKLKNLDLQLFRILKLQDVKTKSFMLRWIRCLHTRQFGIDNSLYIWDSIFLDYFESPNSKKKNQFEFVDAFCLAMFIYLRSIVLTRETSNEILQVYQKYPVLAKGQYLEELVNLAWSVCEELRNQFLAQQNQSSNWYEDSNKAKNLGLMEKGGYAATVKQQELQDKKQRQLQYENHISKESEEIQKQSNALFIQKKQKNNEPLDSADLFPNKKKNEKKEEVKVEIKPKIEVEKKLTISESELKQIISTLKQSITLNDDIESRALANKVLKSLESKLSEEDKHN